MSIFTSLLTAGSNSHQETSENVNAVATDFVSNGIVGALTNTAGVAPATGGFAVNAQGSPNMTVAVSSGVAYVAATPSSQNSQRLRIRNTASTNVTISANASGSTKYDWFYLSVDATKAANPAVNADDVTTLVTSRSSSSTSDTGTPPTYGYAIAVVTVANAASSITNGNIADIRGRAGVVSNYLLGGQYATVATSETTTSASFTDLTTPGPAVTVSIGINGMALVILTGSLAGSATTCYPTMGFVVSGANTIAATEADSLYIEGTSEANISFTKLITGLTAGSTTFTTKYERQITGTGSFRFRKIQVIPL